MSWNDAKSSQGGSRNSELPTWYPCFGDWGEALKGGAILFSDPIHTTYLFNLEIRWWSAHKNLSNQSYAYIFCDSNYQNSAALLNYANESMLSWSAENANHRGMGKTFYNYRLYGCNTFRLVALVDSSSQKYTTGYLNGVTEDIGQDTYYCHVHSIGHLQQWSSTPFVGIPRDLRIYGNRPVDIFAGMSFGVKSKTKPAKDFIYDFSNFSAGMIGTLVGSFRWVRWDDDFLDYTEAPIK